MTGRSRPRDRWFRLAPGVGALIVVSVRPCAGAPAGDGTGETFQTTAEAETVGNNRPAVAFRNLSGLGR